MIAFRKYTWLGLIAARSNLAYLGEVATRTLFLAVILYIFLQLWRVTYSETASATLGGLTLAQMLWYLAMTEAITLSTPRVAQEVDQDVRTGALAVQLIRPLDYPLARLWMTMGERLVRFGLNVAVGCTLALLLVGPIAFTPAGLLMFALTLPLAFGLDFAGNFLIGLAAFWIEDTTGLALIYSRVTMILGGMLSWPLDKLERVLTRYAEFVAGAPDELNLDLSIVPAGPRAGVIMEACWSADHAAGERVLAPLRAML